MTMANIFSRTALFKEPMISSLEMENPSTWYVPLRYMIDKLYVYSSKKVLHNYKTWTNNLNVKKKKNNLGVHTNKIFKKLNDMYFCVCTLEYI
jgi:hypothetical protein